MRIEVKPLHTYKTERKTVMYKLRFREKIKAVIEKKKRVFTI